MSILKCKLVERFFEQINPEFFPFKPETYFTNEVEEISVGDLTYCIKATYVAGGGYLEIKVGDTKVTVIAVSKTTIRYSVEKPDLPEIVKFFPFTKLEDLVDVIDHIYNFDYALRS